MPDAIQLTLDQRSLCGIKGCENKATRLVAWPLRLPVPLCERDWQNVQQLTRPVGAGEPRFWLNWIRQNGKQHIL